MSYWVAWSIRYLVIYFPTYKISAYIWYKMLGFFVVSINIVKETTTALWCSNRGMSESELVELLQVIYACYC